NTVKITDILELRQGHELLPIQNNWVFNVPMDFQFPFIQGDLGANSQIQHREIMNLPLAWRQTVGRSYRGSMLSRHFARPALFGGNVGLFHSKPYNLCK